MRRLSPPQCRAKKEPARRRALGKGRWSRPFQSPVRGNVCAAQSSRPSGHAACTVPRPHTPSQTSCALGATARAYGAMLPRVARHTSRPARGAVRCLRSMPARAGGKAAAQVAVTPRPSSSPRAARGANRWPRRLRREGSALGASRPSPPCSRCLRHRSRRALRARQPAKQSAKRFHSERQAAKNGVEIILQPPVVVLPLSHNLCANATRRACSLAGGIRPRWCVVFAARLRRAPKTPHPQKRKKDARAACGGAARKMFHVKQWQMPSVCHARRMATPAPPHRSVTTRDREKINLLVKDGAAVCCG